MKLKWKIFQAMNVVEMVSAIGFLALTFYRTKSSFLDDWFEVLMLLIVLVFSISVITNSVSNIRLINYPETNCLSVLKNRIRFWFLFSMLFLITGFSSWAAFDLYSDIHKSVMDEPLTLETFGPPVWMFLTAVNGYLILYLQVVLFYKIRKYSYETESLLVDTIGVNEEL